MSAVIVERTIECRASRAAMYNRLIDTARLNRAIGNPHLDAKPIDGAEGARFLIRGKLGGVPVKYEEHPFEWEDGRFFSFYRILRGGPGRAVKTRYDFSDNGSGSRVVLRVEATPRMVLTWPIVWIATKLGVAPLVRYIRAVDEELSQADVAPPSNEQIEPGQLQRIRGSLLENHPPSLVEKLLSHVSTADELDLVAIRPFELADLWGVDRIALLRLCFSAVSAALLELRWSMLCPSCRTSAQEILSLEEVGVEGHCHACDLRFGVDLDRAIEARFLPHPAVRHVDERPMCVAGPVFFPHVLAQLVVAGGKEGIVRAPSKHGRYRGFARGGASTLLLVSEAGEASARLELTASSLSPAQIEVTPGAHIVVENREVGARHVKLERTDWAFNAVSAHDVASMPEFRALFGAAALRPGLALKVASVTVLFSDLCGSTALYSRVGDAAAFGVVSDSFAFGRTIIEARGGSVVKTMGDAIMAVFIDPSHALDAAAELVRAWRTFQDQTPLAEYLDIKVGLCEGPCTVVTANRTLDYFGQTVNRAARVQHLAGARQLMLPSTLFDNHALPSGFVLLERTSVTVKGIEEPIALARLGLENHEPDGPAVNAGKPS